MTQSKLIISTFFSALLLTAAGCSNTSSGTTSASATKSEPKTQALETAKTEEEEKAAAKEQEFAKVIRKDGSVSNRGGYIKILVNGSPITNFEIQRRIKFLKLRRVGGNRSQVAEKELIEQALKLKESERLRTLASDEQVQEAFARFAASNKITTARLSTEMRKLGIGENHFKDFIRTQMSWNRSVQRFAQAKNGNSPTAERDIVTGLRKAGEAKPEVTEYFFKRIIFVVPNSKRNARTLAARKGEARALRQRFNGCTEVEGIIKTLKNVSFKNERRVFEPEIPRLWKEPVAKADSRGTTPVIETENGIEFMAICDQRKVNDDRAAVVASRSGEFTDLNKKATELEKEFLDMIRKRATIVYQ